MIAKKHEELAMKDNVDRARMQKKKPQFCFVRLESFDDVKRLIIKAKKKVFSKKWI